MTNIEVLNILCKNLEKQIIDTIDTKPMLIDWSWVHSEGRYEEEIGKYIFTIDYDCRVFVSDNRDNDFLMKWEFPYISIWDIYAEAYYCDEFCNEVKDGLNDYFWKRLDEGDKKDRGIK